LTLVSTPFRDTVGVVPSVVEDGEATEALLLLLHTVNRLTNEGGKVSGAFNGLFTLVDYGLVHDHVAEVRDGNPVLLTVLEEVVPTVRVRIEETVDPEVHKAFLRPFVLCILGQPGDEIRRNRNVGPLKEDLAGGLVLIELALEKHP